ncbi:MAG: hypothetical protein IJ328_07785 [Muribaculaceae bacterium]|nr:hypothetical protein [Muribaculaceae bacterium]
MSQRTLFEKWEQAGLSLSPDNPIVKLTYKREYFDIDAMRPGGRKVTTITDDGKVVIKEYKAGSRKVYSTKTTTCSKVAFDALCDRLEYCIETAKKWDMWVDDCSEELKIFYKYSRVQIVDRGLGNNDIDIGTIMHEFFKLLGKENND